jgi:hypothetical protein
MNQIVLFSLLLLATSAQARTPLPRSSSSYREQKVLSSSIKKCDAQVGRAPGTMCLETELELGFGVRERALRRIKKLAVRRGLTFEVLSRDRGPRVVLRIAGDPGSVELIRRKLQVRR